MSILTFSSNDRYSIIGPWGCNSWRHRWTFRVAFKCWICKYWCVEGWVLNRVICIVRVGLHTCNCGAYWPLYSRGLLCQLALPHNTNSLRIIEFQLRSKYGLHLLDFNKKLFPTHEVLSSVCPIHSKWSTQSIWKSEFTISRSYCHSIINFY